MKKINSIQQRRTLFKELLSEMKRNQGCKVCGETNPKVLHFHHRDPSTKSMNVSGMAFSSYEKFQMELKKCDVLCTKCHGRQHKILRQNFRKLVEEANEQFL